MKEVIALREYSDKYVSFYEGEIRNITDDIANTLIAKGIVRLHTDIPEGGGGGTVDSGYSVERQQYVEEQTVILSYDSEAEAETWSGVLQGGYLPEVGTEIKVTLNDGPVIKATVQEDLDGLIVSLRDDDNGYIEIYQSSDTGITTLYSSIPFTDNEVTISAQGEFVTTTDDFKAAVTTANSGSFIATYTIDEENSDTFNDEYVYKCDKKLAEILEAIDNNLNVFAILEDNPSHTNDQKLALTYFRTKKPPYGEMDSTTARVTFESRYTYVQDSSPEGVGDNSIYLQHGYETSGEEYINVYINDIWLEIGGSSGGSSSGGGTQFVTCNYVNSLTSSHSFSQIINLLQVNNQNVIVKFANYNSPYENQRHYLTLLDTNVIDSQRIVTFGKTFLRPDGDIGVGIYVYKLQFRQNSDPAFVFRRYDLSHGTYQNIITVGSIYE